MKKAMKTGIISLAVLALAAGGFAACGKDKDYGASSSPGKSAITVVSREDGSGTRGAFIELFGVEEKDADGNKVDKTTLEANITNSTSVMMTTVAGEKSAIGYISLGSFNDSVKAVKIDGVTATAKNIKNGTYKIARPFNIAAKADASALAKDFIAFIMSTQGQAVVADNGYIAIDHVTDYTGDKPAGKIVIAGSSSVSPVMEKLMEAYKAINTNAEIEIQTSDSTTGMNSVVDGICDIGMASRALKDSELEKGLTPTVIAQDGIAVIVNKSSTVDDLTTEQVKKVFTGAVTDWSEIG